ncbi:MAG: type VI secretion system baseplate subunit TssE [Verrucomicrobiae bacterium]|nr:type VI secretion system baseplate subunit TssE [Verrucomicrobiae bacterium]
MRPTSTLPCLFERICSGESASAKGGIHSRLVSISQYRKSVLEDLRNLLGNCAILKDEEAASYPESACSVLNYGIRFAWGSNMGLQEMPALEYHIKDLLLIYEPRFDRASLKVTARPQAERPDSVALEIEAQLWCHPVPEYLKYETRLDLNVGVFVFNNLG